MDGRKKRDGSGDPFCNPASTLQFKKKDCSSFYNSVLDKQEIF